MGTVARSETRGSMAEVGHTQKSVPHLDDVRFAPQSGLTLRSFESSEKGQEETLSDTAASFGSYAKKQTKIVTEGSKRRGCRASV